ncbi:metal-dependent hydrolase [Streptomyces sp. SAT1]|uniref:endonuclease/exonuclease/phosphatase family protein n=1 Tax=Streptomyces sp. SAT1 TaxID=1849967 RepID=UPI0007DD2744|nr:endonuclease/exonuclease/phosphatase family protein [Streptomyces sp. SAT1]ANH95785.1 metal-dependent hydrolase [Streptomyces sp. SAT1]
MAALALTAAATLAAASPGAAAARPQTGAPPTGAPQGAPPVPLRVATYDIHAGAGEDGVLDLDRTARAIGALHADVIGLQEVDVRRGERSAYTDEARELARRLRMRVFFAPLYDLPAGPGHAARRRFGVAVLSRLPLVSAGNHTVPAADVGPKVLVGDFNAEPGAPELARLWGPLADAAPQGGKTCPAGAPDRRIDVVAVSPKVAVAGVREAVTTASDHRPVVAGLLVRRPRP